MLLRGTVDVAVIHRWACEEQAAATPASVDVVVLGTDRVDLLAPADDPLTAHGVVTFDDCVDRPWIQTLSGSVYDWWLAGKFSEAGVELKPAHRANEFSTQLALVEAGAGLALIPRLGRKRLSDSVRVLSLDGAPEREVFVAWRTSSEVRPGIRTVRESFRRSWMLWSEE
jgi:DNA-binding transcriptional LysR family regulator